jgi:hypothetical protein
MGTTKKIPNLYTDEKPDEIVLGPQTDENGEVIVKQMPGSLESSGILDSNMLVNL